MCLSQLLRGLRWGSAADRLLGLRVRIPVPIPVTERFKARVCCRPLAGIAGSNPAGGHGSLWCVCYTVRTRGKKSQDDQDKEVRIMYRARERERTNIPPGAWVFVSCECCVLSDRGFCGGPISRPEEFYWLWCVIVSDVGTSGLRWLRHTCGCCARDRESFVHVFCLVQASTKILYTFLISLLHTTRCHILPSLIVLS